MTIVQTGRLTATETGHRNQISAAMPGDGTQLGVVQGVQSGLLLTKTAGMGWQVDLGRCSIAPATPANGAVTATVTVAETGTFANGDATRDRIDVVGLQIDETATIANGNPAVKSVIIQGAYPVSGQPVTPTIPAGTIGLWSVRVNANTSAGSGGWNTANLVDLRPNSKIFHAEYTGPAFATTGGTGVNFGGPGAGLFGVDTAKTFNNSFVQPDAAGRLKILIAGTYSLSGIILPTTVPASYSLQINDITNSAVLASFGGVGYGNKEQSIPAPNVNIAANTVIEFNLVTSNAVTLGSRVRITKLQG